MTAPAKDKPHKSAVGLYGSHTIYGREGEHDTPYMTRTWFGRLRLHIFHRGDADPDCHDHPWDFWTFPLTSYVEEVVTKRPIRRPDEFDAVMAGGDLGYETTRQLVRALRLTYRPATHCHRVLGRYSGVWFSEEGVGRVGRTIEAGGVPLTDPRRVVTIVWRGGLARKWGFLRNRDGKWCWTPWKEYVFGGGKDAPCSDAEGGGRPQ